VLVVRAWVEGAARTDLRARITRTDDVTGKAPVASTATTADQILVTVRVWLESLMAESQTDGDGSEPKL
jgi:hypothetical protein